MNSLKVNEVFLSIQGESSWTGRPCVFVRMTGCQLRCRYCDTEYAFHDGKRLSIDELVRRVDEYQCDLVEVTGGEPLLHEGVFDLMQQLCDMGKTVLVETSGACDISCCDPRVIRIMDLKTPDSGEADRNLWANLDHLTEKDEVKLVICSQSDYLWAKGVIMEHRLYERVHAVLMSPVEPICSEPGEEIPGLPGLPLRDLAQWILDDCLPVQLQIQLHKLIWDPAQHGV